MRLNYYHYTSGVIPRKHFQQISKLLFRITKSNGIIQILDFEQTHMKKREESREQTLPQTGEFNPNSLQLIWGKPMFDGQELSIFFINIPRSRFLIEKIFKVLEAHEAMFIEIPKSGQIHNETMALTEKINEYRIIIRRSFYNLDSKIRPYYAPREVRLVDEVKFQEEFNGMGNSGAKGTNSGYFNGRTRGSLHFANRRGAPAESSVQNAERGNEQVATQQNQKV